MNVEFYLLCGGIGIGEDGLCRGDFREYFYLSIEVAHAVVQQGVRLLLGDPRLLTKPYGKTFIDAMPPFARTRELGDVQRFFDREDHAKSARH